MAPPGWKDVLINLVTKRLKQELDLVVHYDSKVQKLDKDVTSLQDARDNVELKADEEETRYGKQIDVFVPNWLEDANKIILEYEKFNEDEDRQFAEPSCCSLPIYWDIRRRLSIKSEDIAKKVTELLQNAPSHDKFFHWHGPPSIDAVLLNIDYVSFESRQKTVNDIMTALEDSSVRMIGVRGWSGVGKTTLVKEVAKKAREARLFNMVIMVNVTRNPDIIKIQGQIAEMLGMKLEEKSDIGRAARIRKILENEKLNTLIILDDLWEKLDFSTLGIPFANDGKSLEAYSEKKAEKIPDAYHKMKDEKLPSAYHKMKDEKLPSAYHEKKTKETGTRYIGCKVLLISETKQVLMSQMDRKDESIFSVEVLMEKEAETLFKKMAGIDDDSEFKKLAAQIANKCEGLPMSIVTTARALKNQRPLVWEDVHRKLERQKLTGTPEFSTKLSYDLLENEELKYTFLLCASMGKDALIIDLVRYCIGLGFLQGIYTVWEARDRVHVLVGKLKESGLLSDSYSSDRFTMPDIVHRAALSIAPKEFQAFTMTKGKLDEWPDVDELERYAAISLQHCDIIEKFPESISCPRLRVFQVDSNDPHLKIPDNFFKGMKELRVLILAGIHLSPLPSSIRCLTKLRMLCLERCTLGDLCIIGEMEKLRVLSLSGSDIEPKLPGCLKQLTKLQIFDLSNCSKLKRIPSGVLSSLISLEELYLRNTSIEWEVEGQTNQSDNASLSELRHLDQLTTIDLQIPNAAYLPTNLFFDKLYSYKIVIGDLNAFLETESKMPEKYEASRFLALNLKDGFDIHSQKGIKMLFERVENLLLEDLSGVEDIFYELNLKGFSYLKNLSIVSNSDIQSLIKSKDRDQDHPEKAFPKLELLYLYNLKNMKEICSCTLSAPSSFGKLKVIKIKLCGQLKNLFLISVARLLTVLETIEVYECNSLKEIVQSNTNEVMHLEFPQLRTLRLLSLSKFMGFYLISSEGETGELFHEQVLVSKLERLELSSIQINRIWSDQPSQSPYFQNLMHLDVNGCGNLKYLLSFSMAKCLVKLQSLFISECEKMEHIFPQSQDGDANMKGSFPNLKNIKLSSLKSLSEIWNSEVPLDSFGKLDTLIIEECDKLVNVFPCYMVEIFQSLRNLRVTNCRLMKAIFDLNDQKQDAGDVINLQNVSLEALPKLEHVWKWKKGKQRILNLKNLQKIRVLDCNSLENIFQDSIAQFLENLEYLAVWSSFELREIVAEGEGTSSPYQLVFPKLTTISFSELPKLKSFYRGALELDFPVLNNLCVLRCDKLELLRKETADAPRRPLFPEKVINNLKSVGIDIIHAKSSRRYMGNYRRDNLEEIGLARLTNTEILYSFLHSNPNLKSLSLKNCFFEELVPLGRPREIEKLGVVPKLKSLMLVDLPNLEKIGFERDPVLQRIESFILKKCPCLVTIVPSSVSFAHLTNLEVVNCNGLKSLMAPSTAKSLGQLNIMKVISCESLEKIVSEPEIEDKIDIVFKQLEALELVSLKNLGSFCSSKSCVFEFPLLEKLVINACPKMKNFSEKVKSTPLLQKIYVVHEKEKRWHWEGKLEATIQKMFEKKNFFEGMDELNVSDYLELQQAWNGKVGLQNNWFYSLETLMLENCEIQPYAIPSNVLPYLKSLKELKVRDCDNVEGIFDMYEDITFQLKKLTLEGLKDLTNVWKNNCEAILSFQNLQQVIVSECHNLQTLFPAAIAKNLKKLESLEIASCNKLQEIVGKEVEEAATNATEMFEFLRLTLLGIAWLPQLTYFYPGRFTLECPQLQNLYVIGCDRLEVFQSQQDAHQGSASNSINKEPLFSDLKAISNLEEWMLDWKEISNFRFGQFAEDLQYLNYLYLFFDNEKSSLPVTILQKAPNLETMFIDYCSSLEIFPANHEGENRMLRHLKTLFLKEVFELHMGSEDSSWLNTICDKLHELNVFSCHCLTTLVHSAVSFSHLKKLQIEKCDELEYLFTSSTAKKFRHLEEMYVKDCESMKEIVKGQDETTSEGIKFERLEKIALESLSNLECFHSGNATLQLPSLIEVAIQECPKMDIFSKGSIHAESFRGIQASLHSNEELFFHHDLNATVKWQFFLHRKHLVLGDYDELEEIWLGAVSVPDRSFSNLKSLAVEGCEFLSNAILPFHLLPFLRKLEELKVQKCNSIVAIFDVKDTPTRHKKMGVASPLLFGLKKLVLENLPNLKHVWNEDPEGSISLPFLEEVLVHDCKSIKSLFPASVAKGILNTLDVRRCEGLVEIVAKDDRATKGAIEKHIIIFPCLTLLTLWRLPNLKCFYPGMHNREWPMLTVLHVYDCQNLKVFESNFQNFPDSHPEGQDCLPTDRQALVSADKVTPHLEQLTLNKEDVVMIEQGQLHVDLKKLIYLKLAFFYEKSDVFPYVFFSKVPLPSIGMVEVDSSNFKEIFPSQRPDIDDYTKILSQLKALSLSCLPRLNSIGLEHSWMAPFPQTLKNFAIFDCNCLTNLVPSTVSFSLLTQLVVGYCAGLQYLFTSSTAKSLGVLEQMKITKCESLWALVEDEPEDDEPKEDDEIIFGKLEILSLSFLPGLQSFYRGSSALSLKFPSLEQVSITQCRNMKMFCHGDVSVPENLEGEIDGVPWSGDINSAIKLQFGEGGSLNEAEDDEPEEDEAEDDELEDDEPEDDEPEEDEMVFG